MDRGPQATHSCSVLVGSAFSGSASMADSRSTLAVATVTASVIAWLKMASQKSQGPSCLAARHEDRSRSSIRQPDCLRTCRKASSPAQGPSRSSKMLRTGIKPKKLGFVCPWNVEFTSCLQGRTRRMAPHHPGSGTVQHIEAFCRCRVAPRGQAAHNDQR